VQSAPATGRDRQTQGAGGNDMKQKRSLDTIGNTGGRTDPYFPILGEGRNRKELGHLLSQGGSLRGCRHLINENPHRG